MRWFALALAGGVLLTDVVRGQPTSPASPSVPALERLERYARGDLSGLPRSGDAALAADLRRDLDRQAPAWIAAGRPDAERSRRIAVATFAIDAVHEMFTPDVGPAVRHAKWLEGRLLVEWACRLLTESGPPRPEERIWHLAAIALIEGVGDMDFLLWENTATATRTRTIGTAYDQIGHARARFPDESRLLLAIATAHEQAAGPDPPPGTPWIEDGDALRRAKGIQLYARERQLRVGDRDRQLAREYDRRARLVRTIEEYGLLRSDPAAGAEAHLRSGRLLARLRQHEVALPFFARAKTLTEDVFIRYLSYYFAGETLAATGKTADAADTFRLALETWPHARSASDALAALTASSRDPNAAPPADDPRALYDRGSYRLWSGLVEQLRRVVAPAAR